MEVEEIHSPKQPASKYSRISSNGGGVGGDAANVNESTTTTTVMNIGGGGGRWGRQWGDSSRIIRVSRASGGKDRHSKVWTAKGPRDRRVRLSVTTAIQFYDLQDRLGFDQPSKAVEWLINQASDAINDLPSLDVANFPPETPKDVGLDGPTNGCSSSNNSETSKGSGLSLSRSESRVKARERARERTAKEPGTATDSWPQQQQQQNQNQNQNQNSSFTQLLTAGINTHETAGASSTGSRGMSAEYFGNNGLMGLSFNGTHEIQHHQNHNQNQNQNHFPFLIDQHQHQHHRLGQTAATRPTTSESGFNRGTLQSNSSSTPPSMLSYLQRFSDGSSVPFFLGGAPISPVVDNQHHHHHHDDHQQFNPVGLHLCYGDHKGKGKN